MTGKLYMYNSEQQQFVERGYGTLKINESQDGSESNKLQARLSECLVSSRTSTLTQALVFFSHETRQSISRYSQFAHLSSNDRRARHRSLGPIRCSGRLDHAHIHHQGTVRCSQSFSQPFLSPAPHPGIDQ